MLEGSINLNDIIDSVKETVDEIGIDILLAIITEVNKVRTKLENLRYFTGEMNPEDLWTGVATYLDNAYDLESVENIYIAGDGANWIKSGTEIINGSKYALDHFHLSKYVKIITGHLNRLENPICVGEPLWNYLKTGKREFAMKFIDFAVEGTLSKRKKDGMRNAKRYISNNWEGIKNLFEESKYNCSAEGHISHILSSRLSSRPTGNGLECNLGRRNGTYEGLQGKWW